MDDEKLRHHLMTIHCMTGEEVDRLIQVDIALAEDPTRDVHCPEHRGRCFDYSAALEDLHFDRHAWEAVFYMKEELVQDVLTRLIGNVVGVVMPTPEMPLQSDN